LNREIRGTRGKRGIELNQFYSAIESLLGLGLPALPPIPDAGMDGLVADTWEKLGPAPEIGSALGG
jgi:hypothetical protein